MIYIAVQNPEEFRGKIEKYVALIHSMVKNKVLKQLAEDTVTTITTNIVRQRDIDGGILKVNSPSTIAKKLSAGPKGGAKSLIGKGLQKQLGGRPVKSLIDEGILKQPSTYSIKKISDTHYEISIRAIKSASPDDHTTRDIVGPRLLDMGYKFFGLPKLIANNVVKILQNEMASLTGKIR